MQNLQLFRSQRMDSKSLAGENKTSRYNLVSLNKLD